MKNIILALILSLVTLPVFAGQCSSGSCGRSVGMVRSPVKCLFRRFRVRKSHHYHVSKLESCDMKKGCCGKAECCKNGCCSPKMAKNPVVCTKATCPAGCSVNECCPECCGKKCCPSEKCKCSN